MHVGQTVVTTSMAIGQFFMIEAHLMQYRRMQIVDVHFVLNRVPAVFVSGTMDHATSDSTACHPHRKTEWMMFTAVVAFCCRSASKFSTPQNESVIQQTA